MEARPVYRFKDHRCSYNIIIYTKTSCINVSYNYQEKYTIRSVVSNVSVCTNLSIRVLLELFTLGLLVSSTSSCSV